MDLRVEKTEKAIKNAFIELRSQKPLEKITVKELCAEARINKSTFIHIIKISMRSPRRWRRRLSLLS